MVHVRTAGKTVPCERFAKIRFWSTAGRSIIKTVTCERFALVRHLFAMPLGPHVVRIRLAMT